MPAVRQFIDAKLCPLRVLVAASALVLSLAAVRSSGAQSVPGAIQPLELPTSIASDWRRLRSLAGDTTALDGYLLRSPSSTLFQSVRAGRRSVPWRRFVPPTFTAVVNSALPYSMNDGALWAGRGLSVRAVGGLAMARGRLRVLIAPEYDLTANAQFDFDRDLFKFHRPSPPEPRYGGGYANPWYSAPYSADLPWRFGSAPRGRLMPGQTGVWYNGGPVEAGITTENAWWGPGIENAIVLSDNAAGVPRLELRSGRPLHTRAGVFEWRWFVGALSESKYFDTDTTNNVRSLAAAAVTWRPAFQPTLTLGATRAVYGTVSGFGAVPFRWFDVFARTSGSSPGRKGPPSSLPSAVDSSLYPGGRAQLFSLFGRWVFPEDGFETYGEFARQTFPRSLRDALTAPTYSAGYTFGAQWRRPAPLTANTLRAQFEMTSLEQAPPLSSRPIDVFYTSRRVVQGYTQQGQVLGAAIGPGASSQLVALDRVGPGSSLGFTLRRIRWNEDVRSTFNWPAYVAYCNHDVSILPGIRGGRAIGSGYVSGEMIVGTRFNVFFQNQSGCPTGGPSKIDMHNTMLTLSFSPFHR